MSKRFLNLFLFLQSIIISSLTNVEASGAGYDISSGINGSVSTDNSNQFKGKVTINSYIEIDKDTQFNGGIDIIPTQKSDTPNLTINESAIVTLNSNCEVQENGYILNKGKVIIKNNQKLSTENTTTAKLENQGIITIEGWGTINGFANGSELDNSGIITINNTNDINTNSPWVLIGNEIKQKENGRIDLSKIDKYFLFQSFNLKNGCLIINPNIIENDTYSDVGHCYKDVTLKDVTIDIPDGYILPNANTGGTSKAYDLTVIDSNNVIRSLRFGNENDSSNQAPTKNYLLNLYTAFHDNNNEIANLIAGKGETNATSELIEKWKAETNIKISDKITASTGVNASSNIADERADYFDETTGFRCCCKYNKAENIIDTTLFNDAWKQNYIYSPLMNLPEVLNPKIIGSDDIGIVPHSSNEAIINSNLEEFSGVIHLDNGFDTLTFNNGFANFKSEKKINLNINAPDDVCIAIKDLKNIKDLSISANASLESTENNEIQANALKVQGLLTILSGTSIHLA